MNVAHALICSKLGPLGVTCRNPGGGYFLWVQFPKEISTEKLLPECKQNGVTFLCGNWASYTGEFKNCLRICIAYYEEEELLRGLDIFCRISAEHMLKRANISTAC
uniref:Aminotransferase class I/classII domain-containing protein n=1 Tax=Ciona savignyi TaxID=51511 RepID=H2YBS3_CIOSA